MGMAGRAPDGRGAPVRRDHEAGTDAPAIGERRDGAGTIASEIGHLRRGDEARGRQAPDQLVQPRQDMAVLDHGAERAVTGLLVVVMQEQGRIAVGHANLLDRLRRRLEISPEPYSLEHAHGT